MIGKILKWIVGDVSDHDLDTIVYVLLGACPFVMSYLNDEAPKYIPLLVVFYLKGVIGTVNASLATLKAYRSTGYAKAQAQKLSTGNTDIITKTP